MMIQRDDMMPDRYFQVLIIVFLLLSVVSSPLYAEKENGKLNSVYKLSKIKDIRNPARLSQAQNLPILIMFGTEECPYCELLREDFLIPMIISGDYTDKVILREAHVADGVSIINFTGRQVSSRDFAGKYGVKLYPTMVLVDDKGKPLVNKIIGITTPSLFGGTLDTRIDEALRLTRKINSHTKSY